MARPKKKPEYNSEEVSQQIIEAITDAYLNPSEGTADKDGKMYINLLAEEFSMSRIKVRKLLITSRAYETSISRQINELYKGGKSVKEACIICFGAIKDVRRSGQSKGCR